MMGIARLSSCSRRCSRSRALGGDPVLHGESRPWVPKCPSGVDSEWQLLGEASCSLHPVVPLLTQLSPSPSYVPLSQLLPSYSRQLTRDL